MSLWLTVGVACAGVLTGSTVFVFSAIEVKREVLIGLDLLLLDAMALWASLARICEFGFSPDRVAALGANLILMVDPGRSAML